MLIGSILKGVDLRPALYLAFKNGYPRNMLLKDLASGLTVGVVALPLAMAFAIASGAPPERGLYTAIVAGLIISLLGGSRYQIGGPTGAFVVIVAGIMAKHGYAGLMEATLLAGGILIVMGLLNFGRYLKFIPYPVITGFTSGIAVIIFTSQIKDFFGLPLESVPSNYLAHLKALAMALPNLDATTLAVGLGTLGIMLFIRRHSPRIPAPIAGIGLATMVVWLLGLDVVTIGGRFGGVPSGLPSFSLPSGFPPIGDIFPDALTIAFLAGIESLLSAVVADGMTRERHNPSMELVAQGTANVFSSVFGGIPATGAIARTATNIRAGAFSPVSGIVHALSLALFMVALTPLADRIPLAGLAAVLILVAFDMSEIDRFRQLLKAPKSDALILLLTFGLTILVDLTVAVQVGVVLAALLFMKRMSDMTGIQLLPKAAGNGDIDGDATAIDPSGADVEIYEIDGPLFFGVSHRFTDIMRYTRRRPKAVVLRMRHVPTIDASAVAALESVIKRLKSQGTTVVLTGVNERVVRILGRMGILDIMNPENVFSTFQDAQPRIDLLARGEVNEPD